MDLFSIAILLSAGLTISNANQFTFDSSYPPPNFPSHYWDANVYTDPRLNQFPIQHYNNFESQKVPKMASGENDIGIYQIANQFPGSTWPSSTVNGPFEEIYRLPQTQTLFDRQDREDPFIFHNRGFPISPVYFDMVKGVRHEIPTEAPINAEDIRFGPSASHVFTAPMKITNVQPHIIFKPNSNRGHEHEHSYKTVEKLHPKAESEVITQDKQVIENVPDKSTKLEQVSTSTIPPVPTLSPWLDGFRK